MSSVQLKHIVACLLQVTDLLFQKHTQLERMTAEKAAQQLTTEREIATAREYAERTHRSVLAARKYYLV